MTKTHKNPAGLEKPEEGKNVRNKGLKTRETERKNPEIEMVVLEGFEKIRETEIKRW